jgi:DNA mismatch endonuclease, patch repair protein
MSGIRGSNTKPELFLRKALHARGFRYRVGGAGLMGRPDLVFPSLRTVVFVHGCFWHRHDCEYFRWPQTRRDFWEEKLHGNAARDVTTRRELQKQGWQVLTVWECELRATRYTLPNPAVTRVARSLEKARSTLKDRREEREP